MAGISINLAGNFSKLDELKGKAEKSAKGIKAAFASDMGKKMFAGIAVAGTAAFAAIAASMKSAIDAGGELSDQMARTGAEGKGLFILGQAFKNAGMAAGQVPQVLNKMQKALAGLNEEGEKVTSRVFTDLGLSIQKLQAMDPVAAFQEIGRALATVEDPAQRAALGMEIFGRSAGQLLVLMNDSAAFGVAEEQMGGLAETLADNAAELDKVSDSLKLAQLKMQQLGAEVAVALLPELTKLADALNELDMSHVGAGIGDVVRTTMEWAEALLKVREYLPYANVIPAVAELLFGGAVDQEEMKRQVAAQNASDPDFMKGRTETAEAAEAEESAAFDGSATANAEAEAAAAIAAKEADKAAVAAEKKAEADAKSAAEAEKSKRAAMEAYNMESKILSARISGDEKRIQAAIKEKAIKEEIARLEQAGFTFDEAKEPAEAKVDAEIKASDLEEQRKADADAATKRSADAAAKTDDITGRIGANKYDSAVGAVSSMQRIGGGGGVTGSGLDYQRQAVDLQREMVAHLASMARAATQKDFEN